jgi:hypothetical protein
MLIETLALAWDMNSNAIARAIPAAVGNLFMADLLTGAST